MSARDCLRAKAAAGVVSRSMGKAAQDRIKEIHDGLVSNGESPTSAALMAEVQYQAELKYQTAKAKWKLIDNVRVRRDIEASIAKTAISKQGKAVVDAVEDADFDRRSISKEAHGRIGKFLESQRAKFMGGVRKPAEWSDILDGMSGEAVGPEAKVMVDAINDVNEWFRKKMNQYGHSIPKLKNWGLPHKHDAEAISTAGMKNWTPADGPKPAFAMKSWTASTDKRLDWAGMVSPKTGLEFGMEPPKAYRVEFLQAVWKSIVFGRDSKNPQWGQVAVQGSSLDSHRVLKFKTSKDWKEYNAEFGSSDPFSTLLSHIDHMSREVALAKKFGPEPEVALQYWSDKIAERHSKALSSTALAWGDKGRIKHAQGMMRVMRGGEGPSSRIGKFSARWFSTTRKTLSSALLSQAIVISMPSDMNSATIAAHAIGANPLNNLSVYASLLGEAAKGGGATREWLLQIGHSLDSIANAGVTMDRYNTEYPAAAWAEWLSDTSMKIQGMNAHTDAIREVSRLTVAGEFALHANTSLDKLHSGLKALMDDAGVTAADWDAFRRSGNAIFTAPNGAKYLSPLYWHKVTSMDPMEADDLFLKMQSVVERYAELAVPSYNLKVQGLMNPVAWQLTPGHLGFEALKSTGMFKSFLGAFLMNQAKLVSMKNGVWNKAAYLGYLTVSTTAVGMLAMTVSDLIFGRDPQEVDGDFVWRGFLKGGAVGPLGDILASGTTSFGGDLQDYLAGPTIGFVADAGSLTLGNALMALKQSLDGDSIDVNLAKDLSRFFNRYLPMGNHPAVALAIDRLLADQFQLFFDPGSIKDMHTLAKKRRKVYEQGYWWPQGSPLPSRAPNFGNAFGG